MNEREREEEEEEMERMNIKDRDNKWLNEWASANNSNNIQK